MPPRRKALEAAHAQILLHSQAHEAAQAQMLLHSQAHAAAQAQIVALQARVNALELKLEQRGSDATASDMRAATTTTTPLFASRTMHSVVLVLLGLLPLASCGTVCGHGYITSTNEATSDVSISLTGIASQTANFVTIVDDGSNAIASIDSAGALSVASTITFSGMTDNAAVAFMTAKTAHQDDATVDDVITFDEVITNVGSAYDTTTSTFTAPYDGVYRFSAVVLSAAGSTTGVSSRIYKNGADTKIAGFSDGEEQEQATLTATLSLTQGDEITIAIGDSGAGDDVYGSATYYNTFFEGSLLTRT